ncbi:hypothetical protein L1987_51460 [Smallanthus sonchifolius]|uniref:Uncharacterized protein n=1 Tax=Smallanthus sonchifolius TaxID=185202 RepID=A0ACB9EQ33_9ASTR|nr:hypothetical protein L1987_51460 [Smallanthus sonchifolius]
MSYYTLLYGLCHVGCARMADSFELRDLGKVVAVILDLQHSLKLGFVLEGSVPEDVIKLVLGFLVFRGIL